ncbi:hypothetical protein JTE90_028996 [Oedothorax gibbosus]|uniref:Phosphoprotein n=1 Tax=Oedothorax gibbosus TaxID=931172 RepID=A0AAV6VIS0_9ARAC|nr:hypothetical protein JTE90_028996 [Oedothorax gibbosus]
MLMSDASKGAVAGTSSPRLNIKPLANIDALQQAMLEMDELDVRVSQAALSNKSPPLEDILEDDGENQEETRQQLEERSRDDPLSSKNSEGDDERSEYPNHDDSQQDEEENNTTHATPTYQDSGIYVTRQELNEILSKFATQTFRIVKENVEREITDYKNKIKSDIVREIDRALEVTKTHMGKSEQIMNQLYETQIRMQQDLNIFSDRLKTSEESSDAATTGATKAIQAISSCKASILEITTTLDEMQLNFGTILSTLNPSTSQDERSGRPLGSRAPPAPQQASQKMTTATKTGGLNLDELLRATVTGGKTSPDGLPVRPVHTTASSNYKYEAIQNLFEGKIQVLEFKKETRLL